MACDGDLVFDTTLGKCSFGVILEQEILISKTGTCVDGNTIPIGNPCTTQIVVINDKKVIEALEGQVQCEANYVETRLVSVIEELLLQGQTSKLSL